MFTIQRRVEAAELRSMCIAHNYYTKGDCNDYGEMLLKFQCVEITEKELEWLAKNIKSHSDTEDAVIDIAFNILTEACYEYLED